MSSGAESGPNFLLDWHESDDSRRYWRAGIGTLVVHAGIFALVFTLASLNGPAVKQGTEIVPNFRQAVHLILPSDLTQKAPNKGKVAKEVNVEDLKPRPPSLERLPPAPALRAFRPPNPAPPGQPQPSAAPPRIAEPPKIEAPLAAQNAPPALPAMAGTPKAPPPPQIQPVEQPKLAFETPGQNGPSDNKGQAKLPPPKTGVQDVIHDMARGGGGQGRIVVGDLDQPPDLPSIRQPTLPGQTGSSLELQSDAMGVDFKPYLIQILALVKKNWFAVWPESARLGNRGMVQLMFSIDRSGQVPKLVIATPSGSEALDRAAVAGISATVPFPPLPNEFRGQQIRLQLSFKYNVR
jgi:TonB family protein